MRTRKGKFISIGEILSRYKELIRNNKKRDSQAGFTLIELAVVALIISILATIIIGAVSEVRARAKDARRWQEINQLIKVIEVYGVTEGEWPGVSDATGAHISPNCDSDLKSDLIDSGLISIILADPSDDNASCDDDGDDALFYGWDAAHCCGSCLASGSTTCQMCISINRFETDFFRNKYGKQSVVGGGDANMDDADFNYCFDTDTIYGN